MTHTPTVFSNGRILTMDGDEPTYAETVAIKDGIIVFVGGAAEAEDRYPGFETRDLKGQTMLPGLVDPHGHFMFALNMVSQANVANPPVGPCTDIPSTIAALEAFKDARDIPEGSWIVGWGYDQDGLAEGRHMTKFDLDEYFPNHLVMLIHVSAHGAIFNSKALEWAGVNPSTETPDGGIIARVGDSNEPVGLLMETAYIPVFGSLPQPSEAEVLELLGPAQQTYARDGYTHVQEGFTFLKDLHFLMKGAEQGRLYLDVISLPGFTEASEWLDNPDYTFGEYNNHLKLQGMKITQDGSPQGRTAHVTEPYLTGGPAGQKSWVGETTQPTEDFEATVQAAVDAGLQVFVHANGDATIDQLIEAVRKTGITAADDRRTIAIHSQFQRPDHLPEYLELGISPSYFTLHCLFWGDVHIRNLGEEKASFISPVKTATEFGLVYSNHTDFNITPLDPFQIIWSAMARKTRSGIVLGPNERVDAYTALQGLTTGPAWQVFEEDRKGRIKEGLLADFVIMSGDPVRADVDNIRNLEVLETIKEGVTVYSAE